MSQSVVNLAAGEMKYSPLLISSYDPERHVELETSRDLVVAAVGELGLSRLEGALSGNQINVYQFKGKSYLDRMDIGRVFHEPVQNPTGLQFQRYFSKEDQNPLESAGQFITHNLQLRDVSGNTIFSMPEARFPSTFDYNDALIVASKYFYTPHSPELKEKVGKVTGFPGETSYAHLVTRVSDFFRDEGKKLGYFEKEEDANIFGDELKWLLVNRKGSFNSPVQFNAGLFNTYGITGEMKDISYRRNPKTGVLEEVRGEYVNPQCHACFIEGPRDDLGSIVQHMVHEAAIFEHGSGVGQDIGRLRSRKETLSGGGKPSGPLSFFKAYDVIASMIKSGGKTRRAARMTTMRYNHGDIMDFVDAKQLEEKKIFDLMSLGYSGGMDGDAATTATYQNTNTSVRLDGNFFKALKSGGEVDLIAVDSGRVIGKLSADKIMKGIAFGAWRCGDPGVQYEDKIQEMHTCKNSGRQNSTNPCSEYLFLDHTSCNLASLNLAAFADEKGNFDIESFKKAIHVFATAQDIANDVASYPVKEIAQISPEFRTIGLGYANLGALLMRMGLPYDSDQGRDVAASITALMTGETYAHSARMAEKFSPFVHFNFNKKPMLEVIKKHKNSLENILWESPIKKAASESWENALSLGEKFGYRNAQATVLAPTGTISFIMGAEFTGVEPGYSPKTWKNLAGGGGIGLRLKEIETGLKNIGYSNHQVKEILDFMDKENTVVGAPHLRPEHFRVFDTAVGDGKGRGAIDFSGHLEMLAAVQPFISGAISKTCNVPNSATVKDFYDAYLWGQEHGLKALAVFRDGSKATTVYGSAASGKRLKRGEKEELPSPRQGYETEVIIGDQPIHVIATEYGDGRPGQIVFLAAKSGSHTRATLDTYGIDGSTMLKYGVPLEKVIRQWRGQKFEPSGLVSGDPHIKNALSPIDYAAKWLDVHYLGNTDSVEVKPKSEDELRGAKNGAFETYRRMNFNEWDKEQVLADPLLGGFVNGSKKRIANSTAPSDAERGLPCKNCGNLMKQTKPGCFKCLHCGEQVGGCGL